MAKRISGVRAPLAGALSISSALVLAAVAEARVGGTPLNGSYLVTSNGDWAKTNDVFRDEATVRQVWTITSTCVDSTSCTGRVTSNQGWSADINYSSSSWTVSRVVPDWEPCPDGTTAQGNQKYRFWGVDPAGQTDDTNTMLLAGNDTTSGASGACGVNKPLVITIPLRLQKIDQ